MSRSSIVLPWVSVLSCALGVASAADRGPSRQSVVAADGTGDFRSVQEAINAVPQDTRTDRPWTILVKPGVYTERVYIQREKRFVRLIGQNADRTAIAFGLYAGMKGADGKPLGTFQTPTAWIDADDFTAENLTFENTAGRKGQALAVRIDGDRVALRHCRFLGWQDTVLGNRGRHYFDDCYIAGACDFIFGGATEFFNRCRIHCTGSGYVTAASTPENQSYGLVFSHCKVTAETPDVKSYLGRPWRPYGSVTWLDTELPGQIQPEGWDNWRDPSREATVRYAEFRSIGPGARPQRRVKWSKQLDAAEAGAITLESVLRGADGWNPR